MTRLNAIQNAVLELDGGAYHKLLDEYLFRKHKLKNIHSLGVQTGTNKSTKGIPDSYVENEDGTITLIMYGSVSANAFAKLKEDIESSLKQYQNEIQEGKVKNIIAGYTSTNISPYQLEELRNLNTDIEISFIGLSTLSHDLLVHYPTVASDHLNISIDSEQIFVPREFIEKYDNNEMNTPLSVKFKARIEETTKLIESINRSRFTLVSGQSGVGKTKLVIEACKKLENDGHQVYCVKNNELQIFDDMRYYFGDPGQYILFIDDINQTLNLKYILEFVTNPPKGVSIKIIATIRDYAKPQTINILRDYFQINEILINPFETDEIKDILKESLIIKNDLYLDRIAKISKGNIRLAILAGMNAKEKGYPAINNASDIFKNYYGEIFKNQNLKNKEVWVLFIISLTRTFRLKDNEFAYDLLKEFEITEDIFLEICHRLNESELIDLYHDEVVSMNNQSFRDYIFFYVLIVKKMISISRLLEIGFPKNKDKIIFSLNTIMGLFNTEKTEEYIVKQVNLSWEESDLEDQEEYLSSFYKLNEVKALQIIKKSVDVMEYQITDVSVFDEPINNKNIRNSFISILGGFKYSKYYEEAIELLIYFFNKRLDLFAEFYAVFSTVYSYDEYSHKLQYEKEYQLINKLWELSEYGKDKNLNFLLIHLLREMLKCTIEKVESGDTNKTIQFLTFEIMYTDGTKKIRSLIWEILAKLYEEKLYKKMIYPILSDHYGSVINEEQFKLIFEFDLKCIVEKLAHKWNEPTLEQSVVLNTLKERAVELNIEFDEIFNLYQKNEEFRIYKILSEDFVFIEREDREKIKKTELARLISEYSTNDFDNLFIYCNKFEDRFINDNWTISESISTIFSSIENLEIYVEVISIYLKNNTPLYSQSYERIISKLIHHIGVDATKEIINHYEYDSKNQWLSKFWELIPDEEISQMRVSELLDFVSLQTKIDYPIIPNIFNLEKYYNIDSSIVKKISTYILEMNLNNNVIAQFLNNIYKQKNYDVTLIELFSDEITILEQLYLLNNHLSFDYDGKLLIRLIENNIGFWDEYTQEIAQNIRGDTYFSNKFDLIWSTNNYYELIEIAYYNLVIDKFVYINNGWSETIFSMNDKNHSQKKRWIKKYIKKNKNDMEKTKNIFHLINKVLNYNNLDFFIDFLKHNKNIEDFKQLPIYPVSYSWSGSEIPLIDKRIDFTQELINNLKGLDYIEHIEYLNARLDHLKSRRKETEIQEYLNELY